MSDPRRPTHLHEPAGMFCAGCETFDVLRKVADLHEGLADITREQDLANDSGGDYASNRVEHAIESAALIGFEMGWKLARRRTIDDERAHALEDAAEGFLK